PEPAVLLQTLCGNTSPRCPAPPPTNLASEQVKPTQHKSKRAAATYLLSPACGCRIGLMHSFSGTGDGNQVEAPAMLRVELANHFLPNTSTLSPRTSQRVVCAQAELAE